MSAITAWFDQQHVNFAAMVTSAAVLVIAGLAIPLVKKLLGNWLGSIETRIQLSEATVSAIIRIVSIGLWLIAALVNLGCLGNCSRWRLGAARQCHSGYWGRLSCHLGNHQ